MTRRVIKIKAKNLKIKKKPVVIKRDVVTPKKPKMSIKKMKILSEIPERTSDRVFIFGGGPSIRRANFDDYTGEDTIAVNKSIERISSATIFLTMDYTFFKKTNLSIDQINRKCKHSFFVVNTKHSYIQEENGTYVDKRSGLVYENLKSMSGVINSNTVSHPAFGTSLETFAHGNNSGYAALQLAILMGYKEIYLLGFDYGIDPTRTHYHDGYNNNRDAFNRTLMNYRDTIIGSLYHYQGDNIYTISAYPSSIGDRLKSVDLKPLLADIRKKTQTNTEQVDLNMNTSNSSGDLNNLMVVGYYTKNTPYEKESENLIKSLNKLNLNYDIQGVPNLGSWQANTRFKAKFMLEMLDKHKDHNLLYVDCDAVIHSRPVLFKDYNYDIAVRWQDFRWRKNECLSGTIYMANNQKTREVCKKWMQINKSEGDTAKTFEQWNLGNVIVDMRKSGLNDGNLPPEYTFIFDHMRTLYPNAVPVIEHFQASRKFKNSL